MYGYNQQYNLERINNQIRELEAMRQNYQNAPQPITNVINTGNAQNIDFEARFIDNDINPSEIIIQRDTAFINLNKGQLTIKDVKGNIKEYPIVLPKTKEQLENEELKLKIKEMEMKINELSTINEHSKSNEKNEKSNKLNEQGSNKHNE